MDVQAKPQLRKCVDCWQMMSNHAEACPHCGRFYRNLRPPVVIDRTGWINTIAWGIVCGGILVAVLNLAAIIIFFFYVIAAGSRPR